MRPLPLILAVLSAATLHAEPLTPILLWPGGAPGALGTKDTDQPSVSVFLPPPEKATGAALVVCPGGGYGGLAGHEGAGYGVWLADQGITAVVLKYRLGTSGYRHPVMLQDAARALRLTRSKAVDWKIDPHRVGIMGSSAGGHLASTLLTHFDAGDQQSADPIERESSRPDIGILCYAVITMGANTHSGSRNNLLGPDPKPELVELLSNEKQVTKDTPPCFIWSTGEDKTVKVENSLEFAQALQRNHVPYDLHIYEKGPHGIGLGGGRAGGVMHPWTQDCMVWLKAQGFVR